MELIIGLVVLGILIVPLFFAKGRKMMNRLLFDETDGLFGSRGKFKRVHDRYNDEQWESGQVYDGMITVEIPVPEDQLIAYESLPGEDGENGGVGSVSHVSRG